MQSSAAVTLLLGEFEGKDGLPTASIGFARCCRQAPGLGYTETELLLVIHSFIHSLQVTIKTNLLAELKHQAPN